MRVKMVKKGMKMLEITEELHNRLFQLKYQHKERNFKNISQVLDWIIKEAKV